MKDFNTWYSELVSDVKWFETMSMLHRNKDFKEVSQILYGEYVSDPSSFNNSLNEQRRHLHYKLLKSPVKKIEVFNKPEELKSSVREDYLKGEEKNKYLNEWKENLAGSKIIIPPKMTHKEIAEEGDWIPKKREVAYDPGYYHEHRAKLRKCREMTLRERHPEWTEQELNAKLNELESYQ